MPSPDRDLNQNMDPNPAMVSNLGLVSEPDAQLCLNVNLVAFSQCFIVKLMRLGLFGTASVKQVPH